MKAGASFSVPEDAARSCVSLTLVEVLADDQREASARGRLLSGSILISGFVAIGNGNVGIRPSSPPFAPILFESSVRDPVRLTRDELRLNRHCERSEAIHRAAWIEWIASELTLLAMTTKSVIEPEIVTL
jgi:hypothetical protein